MSSGSLKDSLPTGIHVIIFHCLRFSILRHPPAPTIRTITTVGAVVTDYLALFNLMTALSGRIELGGDLPIIIEPIRLAKATVDRAGDDCVFVVGDVVHHGYSIRKSIVVKVNLETVPGFVFVSNQFAIVIFHLLKPTGVSEFNGHTGLSGNDGDEIRPIDLKTRHFRHKSPSRSVISEPIGWKGDFVHRGDNVTETLKKVKRSSRKLRKRDGIGLDRPESPGPFSYPSTVCCSGIQGKGCGESSGNLLPSLGSIDGVPGDSSWKSAVVLPILPTVVAAWSSWGQCNRLIKESQPFLNGALKTVPNLVTVPLINILVAKSSPLVKRTLVLDDRLPFS